VPRIIWDTDEGKTFETGIDRGMLYVEPFAGVAWNGLVNVTESASGGAVSTYYIDGEAYLAIAGSEEYEATIEAFSSPPEFAPCAGYKRLSVGLYASGQVRQMFGFSYRTLAGDAIQGTSAGYKVHMVYNALAMTPDFTNQSVADRPSAKTRSWDVTAVPLAIDALRLASHFVIDSRRIDSASLAAAENILYGSASTDPRLLTITELLALVIT
jgi:hypothetical protein